MFYSKLQTQISSSISVPHGASSFPHTRRFRSIICTFINYSRCFSATPLRELLEYGGFPAKISPFLSSTSFRREPGDRISYACNLFENMPQRRYLQCEWNGSWDLFKIFQYVKEEATKTGAAIVHALALKQGALLNLRVATSLVTVYSRCGKLESALDFFNEVLIKDVVFWNAMMSACSENKSFRSTTTLFSEMVGKGNAFDSTSLLILISAFSNMKNLSQGKVVHGLSIKARMLSDIKLSNAVINMYAKCGELRSSVWFFEEVECKDSDTWNSIINAYFFNGRPEQSLCYFRWMAYCNYQPDDMSISCSIAACSALQVFEVGVTMHGWSIKTGYAVENTISVGNSLISFYSHLRDINSAVSIFKAMETKNDVSWNAIIKGYFLNGESTKAFSCLRNMQFVASIQPNLATVLTTLPFCAELLLVKEGKAIHGFVLRMQMSQDLSVRNSLTNMYAKCNLLKEAEYLFFTTPNKDLISWNTMVFGYAHGGMSLDAIQLFKKLLYCNSACSLATLLAITPACDSPYLYQLAKSIHGWSIKSGFSQKLFGLNSLMDMYISCGSLSDAFTLLFSNPVCTDVTSWNTILSGCTQKGYFLDALRCFDFMRTTSREHCDSVTIMSVLLACGHLGLGDQGKVIHGLALKTGNVIDIHVQNTLVTMYGRLGDTESATLAFNLGHDGNLCSWNCVLSALSQNEDARKALELFRFLEFEPNETTFSTILSACAQLGAITLGKQIHGQVFRLCFDKNPFISAALVDMYSNSGRLDVAEKVFRNTQEKSVSAWNSLVSAYGFHGFGDKAIQAFEEMTRIGIHPTDSSFTSLISSCSHTGLVDTGLLYYDVMLEKFKMRPAIEHQVCVVHMLGRSGRLSEAREFIKNLTSEPDPGVWGALLSSCSLNGDLEMGKEVAEILFKLEPENVSYYVTLCNMYIAAGRWEEAVGVRNAIHSKQVKKQVGYSMIDTGCR